MRAVVAAVAGTVSGSRLLQFATRGWSEVELAVLLSRLPAGNDAALSGLAEARTGAARDARVALHLLIAVGVGGVLLLDGQPVTGAHGSGGEYGHLPFCDPALACPCSARGCWDLTVDGRALARHRGDPSPTTQCAMPATCWPWPLRDASSGAVRGAVSLGVEHLTSPAALAEWAG